MDICEHTCTRLMKQGLTPHVRCQTWEGASWGWSSVCTSAALADGQLIAFLMSEAAWHRSHAWPAGRLQSLDSTTASVIGATVAQELLTLTSVSELGTFLTASGARSWVLER